MGSASMLGALLASVALSIVSFYTTWSGMRNFLPLEMAWLGTFGIQVLVFLLSWMVAYAIFHRRIGSAFAYLIVYVVAAFWSIIFSYANLYDQVSTPQSRTEDNARFARTFSAAGLSQIASVMDGDVRRLHKDLIESKEYSEWRQSAAGVIDQALRSSQAIEKGMKERKEAESRTIADLQARIQSSRSVTRSASDAVDRAKAEIQRLEPIVKTQRDALAPTMLELESLQQRAKNIEADMKKEETSGGSIEVSGAGRGPIFRRLEADRKALDPILYKKGQEVKTQTQILEAREAELKQARGLLDKANVDLARAEKDVTDAEPEYKASRAKYSAVFAEDAGRVEDIAKRYRDAIATFENDRTLVNMTGAQQVCQVLHDALRKIDGLAIKLDGLSCEPQGVATKLEALKSASEKRRVFSEKCGISDDDKQRGVDFVKIATAFRDCIRLSGLTADREIGGRFATVRKLQDALDQEQAWRGEGADEESRKRAQLAIYVNALTGDKSPQAIGALAVAIVIDLLVLLVAIAGRTMQSQQSVESRHTGSVFENLPGMNLSASSGDSAELRAVKGLLSQLTLRSGTQTSVLDLEAAGLAKDGNVRWLLNLLVAEREARQATEGGRLMCYISPVGYRMLIDRYRDLQAQKPNVRSIYGGDALAGGAFGGPAEGQRGGIPPRGGRFADAGAAGRGNDGGKGGAASGAGRDNPSGGAPRADGPSTGGQWQPKRQKSFLTDD